MEELEKLRMANQRNLETIGRLDKEKNEYRIISKCHLQSLDAAHDYAKKLEKENKRLSGLIKVMESYRKMRNWETLEDENRKLKEHNIELKELIDLMANCYEN